MFAASSAAQRTFDEAAEGSPVGHLRITTGLLFESNLPSDFLRLTRSNKFLLEDSGLTHKETKNGCTFSPFDRGVSY